MYEAELSEWSYARKTAIRRAKYADFGFGAAYCERLASSVAKHLKSIRARGASLDGRILQQIALIRHEIREAKRHGRLPT